MKKKKKNFIFTSKPDGKFRSQLEKKIYEKIKSYDEDEKLEIIVNEKKIIGLNGKKKRKWN